MKAFKIIALVLAAIFCLMSSLMFMLGEAIILFYIYLFAIIPVFIWRFRYTLTSSQWAWILSLLTFSEIMVLINSGLYGSSSRSFLEDYVRHGWLPILVLFLISMTVLSGKHNSSNTDATS